MKTFKPKQAGLLAALSLAMLTTVGCSSLQADNPSLMEAHREYVSAQSNPATREYAATELMQAKNSLDRADRAFSERESRSEVDSRAHVAKQRIAIAQEVGQRKSAEQAVAAANAERDKIRLEARTREADTARANAEMAQTQAQIAQSQAEAAARQAASAQAQAEQAQARNAQLEILLKELNAKQTERGLVITISDVLFDVDRAELKSGGIRSIEKLGALLREDPSRRVLVEGFTDSTGSDEHNKALSGRRAESVRGALLSQGVPPERVTARGFGEAYPVASNDSASGRQMNRRVEIILADLNGPVAQR